MGCRYLALKSSNQARKRDGEQNILVQLSLLNSTGKSKHNIDTQQLCVSYNYDNDEKECYLNLYLTLKGY